MSTGDDLVGIDIEGGGNNTAPPEIVNHDIDAISDENAIENLTNIDLEETQAILQGDVVNMELENSEQSIASDIVNKPLENSIQISVGEMINKALEENAVSQSSKMVNIPIDGVMPLPQGYELLIMCPFVQYTGRFVGWVCDGYMRNMRDFYEFSQLPFPGVVDDNNEIILYVCLQDECQPGEYAQFARIEEGVVLDVDVFENNNIQKGKSVCVFNGSEGMIVQTDTVHNKGYEIGIALESVQSGDKTRIKVLCQKPRYFDTGPASV